MKRSTILTTSALVLAIAMAGCELIPGFGGTKPVNPAKADIALYEQIAVPFTAYYEQDSTLEADTKTTYQAAVTTWSTTGSNWDVYSTIAPPYINYLKTDLDLAQDSVGIRVDTVLSWKIYLENTVGTAPDGVFVPE